MKENIAWLLKNLILPLTPVLCGSLTRYFYSGDIVFDITELAFSVAILYTLLIKSVGRLTDKSLADSLSTICFIGISFCLTIFAYATFVKLQFEHQIVSNHQDILKLLNNNPKLEEVKRLVDSMDFNSVNELMGRVKIFMYVVAIVSVPTTIIFRVKYKLDD